MDLICSRCTCSTMGFPQPSHGSCLRQGGQTLNLDKFGKYSCRNPWFLAKLMTGQFCGRFEDHGFLCHFCPYPPLTKSRKTNMNKWYMYPASNPLLKATFSQFRGHFPKSGTPMKPSQMLKKNLRQFYWHDNSSSPSSYAPLFLFQAKYIYIYIYICIYIYVVFLCVFFSDFRESCCFNMIFTCV